MLWLPKFYALRGVKPAVPWPAGHPFLQWVPRLWTERHLSGEHASVVRSWADHAKKGYPKRKHVCLRPPGGILNNRLSTKKVIRMSFRTGVRFPSSPPIRMTTDALHPWSFFIDENLLCESNPANFIAQALKLRQEFCIWRTRRYEILRISPCIILLISQ